MLLIRKVGVGAAAVCGLLAAGFVAIPASVLYAHSSTLTATADVAIPLVMIGGAITAGALYRGLARSPKAVVLGFALVLVLFVVALIVASVLDAAACSVEHFCATPTSS